MIVIKRIIIKRIIIKSITIKSIIGCFISDTESEPFGFGRFQDLFNGIKSVFNLPGRINGSCC